MFETREQLMTAPALGQGPCQARESALTVPSMSQPVLIRLVLNQARKAELELDTEHQGTEHCWVRVCTGFDKVLTCGYRLS